MEHVIPADIDGTGATDVSDQLNNWIAGVCMSDPSPVIIFPEFAVYRCEYGLLVGSRGHDKLHPSVPEYRATNLSLVGNGASITQTDNTPYLGPKDENGIRPVLDIRKRYGTRIFKGVLAEGLTVTNLSFVGGNTLMKSSVYTDREDWLGIQLVGCKQVVFNHCSVDNIWSDFIYLAGNRNLGEICQGVYVGDCYFNGSGRQGVVMNGIDGFIFTDNQIGIVRRLAFDAEPTAAGQVTNVQIVNNIVKGGALGFFQISAPGRVPVGGIEIARNFLSRPMTIDIPMGKIANDDGTKEVVIRRDLTIKDNIANNEATPYAGVGPMIYVGAWDGVRVTGNQAWLKSSRKVPLKITSNSSNVEEGNNVWNIAAMV